MKSPSRTLLLALLLMFVSGNAWAARRISVIQANDSPFGRRYFSGFSSLASESVQAFRYTGKNWRSLLSRIKKDAPDLVFSIGEIPLGQLTKALPATPLIVADYYATRAARSGNVVLMESALPIGAGLHLARTLFPTRTTVGTIFSPKSSQAAFEAFKQHCAEQKLRVASLKIASAQEIPANIGAFAGKVDLLYWLRDSTTSSPEALQAIYAFAKTNNVPVITLDPSHIGNGALIAVTVDPFKLGEQAWKTARIILEEGKIPQMPVGITPTELDTSVSLGMAMRFGISADAFYTFLQKVTKAGYRPRVEP